MKNVNEEIKIEIKPGNPDAKIDYSGFTIEEREAFEYLDSQDPILRNRINKE